MSSHTRSLKPIAWKFWPCSGRRQSEVANTGETMVELRCVASLKVLNGREVANLGGFPIRCGKQHCGGEALQGQSRNPGKRRIFPHLALSDTDKGFVRQHALHLLHRDRLWLALYNVHGLLNAPLHAGALLLRRRQELPIRVGKTALPTKVAFFALISSRLHVRGVQSPRHFLKQQDKGALEVV